MSDIRHLTPHAAGEASRIRREEDELALERICPKCERPAGVACVRTGICNATALRHPHAERRVAAGLLRSFPESVAMRLHCPDCWAGPSVKCRSDVHNEKDLRRKHPHEARVDEAKRKYHL